MLGAALPKFSHCIPAIHQSRSVLGPLLLDSCMSSHFGHCSPCVSSSPDHLAEQTAQHHTASLHERRPRVFACFGRCLLLYCVLSFALIPRCANASRCLRTWTWRVWVPALGLPPNPAQFGAGGLSLKQVMLIQASLSMMLMTLQRTKVPASLCIPCTPCVFPCAAFQHWLPLCFSISPFLLFLSVPFVPFFFPLFLFLCSLPVRMLSVGSRVTCESLSYVLQ